MPISEVIHMLRRHLAAFVILPVLGLLGAGAITMTTTPQYAATSSVYFSLPNGNTAIDLSQGSTYTQGQIESYAELAGSPRVLQGVMKALPFPTTVSQLQAVVKSSAKTGTVILQISATDPSGAHAARIADETANQLGIVAKALSPKNAKGQPTVDVSTIGEAKVPTVPATPRKKLNLAVGLCIGLFAAAVWALLREKLDFRVHSVDDLPSRTVPVLGVADVRKGRDSHIAVVDAPMSASAEQFRRLRTSVLFTRSTEPEESSIAVTITSPGAGEGKSTVALNLACAVAESGERVLLIDGDMRRPTLADKLDLEGAVGLSTVLAGQAPFEEVVQPVGGDSTLDVLAAGIVPPNPTQLVGSPKMRQLMETVRSIYDVVIVDSPPTLIVTDAALIGPLTSGCLIVVRQDKTRIEQARATIEELHNIEVPVLGTVLTRRAPRFERADSYTYGSGRAQRMQAITRRARRSDRKHGDHRKPERTIGGPR